MLLACSAVLFLLPATRSQLSPGAQAEQEPAEGADEELFANPSFAEDARGLPVAAPADLRRRGRAALGPGLLGRP